MPKQSIVWVTSLGQTLYENLNIYLAYCENAKSMPDRFILFHSKDATDSLHDLITAIQIITQTYFSKEITIQPIAFDDENILSFCENLQLLLKDAQKNNYKIILDISPTTFSFVPVFFVHLSKQFKKCMSSILYLQYANHHMRKKPYPLIPVNSLTLNNLMTQIG